MLGFRAGWIGSEIGWLETFGTSICMLCIQFLLFKSHRARKVLPLEVVPSQPEIYAAISCFWLVYLGSIKTLLHVANLFSWSWSKIQSVGNPLSNDNGSFSSTLEEISIQTQRSNIGLGFQLLSLVLLTWQLHQFTLFTLDTTIPCLIKLTTTQPRIILYNLHYRFVTLITFFHLLTIGHPTPHQDPSLNPNQFQNPSLIFPSSSPNSPNSSTQITLQQTQTPSQNQKERTLSWTLTIPPSLLNEMKETLGPPGGFGELGFCVGREEVRFEGMGVGTSFGLTFSVDGEEEKEEEMALDVGEERVDLGWLNRGKVENGGSRKVRSGVGKRRKTK